DAWGKPVSVTGSLANTVGEANPLRYRGYYYDSETGFYYLNARYYDPEICRWINADTTDVLSLPYHNIGQYNVFAYCNNNPVNDRDDNGQLSLLAKIGIGLAVIVVGAAVVAATAATGGVAAAFIGAAIAGVKAAAISGVIAAGISASTTAYSSVKAGDNFKTVVNKSAGAAISGFADGFMWGGIMAGGSQVLSGGFKLAAQAGVKTGPSGGIGNSGILSPNRLRSVAEVAGISQKGQSFYDYGGQIFRIGSIKLDMTSKAFLHLHTAFTGTSHIPIGTIGAGINGGLR
ncbi:MAG: RHS repeat-associated core domain-containing protein, partial [Coriobacteriales bacterium]|nr:RHS repeat-associated core domain-containing protein [Coriobacteriales bacterium]